MKNYIALMRVKHYVKNMLIFFPAMLTFKLKDAFIVRIVSVGFLLFCITASIVYIINDIKDAKSDRNHPLKHNRPIASGAVSIPSALVLIAMLLIMGILLCFFSDFEFQARCIIYPCVYLAVNIFYSVCLKKIPLLDVLVLVFDYIIRLYYGAVLAGTIVSNWMYLTVMSAAFFMGFGKRRNELLMCGTSMRNSLKGYTEKFLDKAMQSALTLSIVFYSLMCADMNTEVARAGANLLWTAPIIVVICLRYLMLIDRENSEGDPTYVIFSDKFLLFLSLGYMAAVIFCLYFR